MQLLAIAALILATAEAAPRKHPNKCANIALLSLEQIGKVRDDFKHNTGYTHVVEHTPIQNQCNYGGCWAYATLAQVEEQLLAVTGKKIDLSEQYLILRSVTLRAMDALSTPGAKVFEGGWISSADWLIQEFGLLPAKISGRKIWEPRIPFEKNPHSRNLITLLNYRIAQFHEEAARLTSPREVKRLQQIAAKDVMEQIKAYADLPPSPSSFKFTFEGKRYTPLEFARFVMPEDGSRIVMAKAREPALPESLAQTAKLLDSPGLKYRRKTIPAPSEVVRLPSERIEERIKDEIVNKKRSVQVSIEVARAFWDGPTGILSPAAFHLPDGFRIPSRAYRQSFDIDGGYHAVDIVGIDLDENGRVRKYLIKNSWGTGNADGFLHMYADYFEHFLQAAYFRVPAGVKLQ